MKSSSGAFFEAPCFDLLDDDDDDDDDGDDEFHRRRGRSIHTHIHTAASREHVVELPSNIRRNVDEL